MATIPSLQLPWHMHEFDRVDKPQSTGLRLTTWLRSMALLPCYIRPSNMYPQWRDGYDVRIDMFQNTSIWHNGSIRYIQMYAIGDSYMGNWKLAENPKPNKKKDLYAYPAVRLSRTA
jgi:hypothetical protein